MAPAIGFDGMIFIGSRIGEINAFDGATGVKKWQDVGAKIDTPVAIRANGLIYFGAFDGTAYALRLGRRTGAKAS